MAVLPQSLPYVTTVPHEVAAEIAAILIAAEEFYSQGSSFAITAEARIPGMRLVYLSASSLKRLTEKNDGLVPFVTTMEVE